jgi:hypothetical protein
VFVTSNLFKPGPASLTLVSLRKSLCGIAMNSCRPIMVRAGSESMHVCCAPVTVAPPNGTTYAPLQVGALMGGVTASEAWSTQGYFLQLASACGPAFLNVALVNVERFSHFLSLRDSDAQSLEVEEEYQDLPSDLSAYPAEFDLDSPAEFEAVRQSTSSNQSSRASLTLAPGTPALDQVTGCVFQDRMSAEESYPDEKEVGGEDSSSCKAGCKARPAHESSSFHQNNPKVDHGDGMCLSLGLRLGLIAVMVVVCVGVWLAARVSSSAVTGGLFEL